MRQAKLKYIAATTIKQNRIIEEFKSILNSGNFLLPFGSEFLIFLFPL